MVSSFFITFAAENISIYKQMIKSIMISIVITTVIVISAIALFMLPSSEFAVNSHKEIRLYYDNGSKDSIKLTVPSNTDFKTESTEDGTKVTISYKYKTVFGYTLAHKSVMNVGKDAIVVVK